MTVIDNVYYSIDKIVKRKGMPHVAISHNLKVDGVLWLGFCLYVIRWKFG